jgi:hypothetical protein
VTRVIRAMTTDDLVEVCAIERRVFPHPWSHALFAQELERPMAISLVCEEDRLVVAYLIADMFVDVWHIMNVSVDEPYRRRPTSTSRSAARTAATPWKYASPTSPRSSSIAASASWPPASARATTTTTARMP